MKIGRSRVLDRAVDRVNQLGGAVSGAELPTSKKVLLFGKTGDGKSTLANILTTGDIDGEFAAGDSLVAVTKETKEVTNPELNWTIIDTVGMFATDRPVEDHRRVKELRNYLAETHPDIDVFCYVKKASRFTGADEQCWKAFNTLLDGVSPHHHNIALVFTSCREGPGWVAQHQGILDQHMRNKFDKSTPYQIVTVDFPPRNDNSEVETELKSIRDKSLQRLKAVVNGSLVPVRMHKLPESPWKLAKAAWELISKPTAEIIRVVSTYKLRHQFDVSEGQFERSQICRP